jgi:Outer membrane protein beta-barrel domain
MKKMIIFPLLLGVMVANAQLKLGLKAGANISTFNGLDNAESLIAYHAGGLIRWKFKNLVLQPELLYSKQGASVQENGDEKDYKLDYFLVPVMLQWQFGGSLYAEGGFQAGFRANDNFPDNVSAKGTDWSGAFGLGFLKPTGGLGIGARYTLGLANVADADAGDDEFKNGVWQISIIYLFK